MNTDDQIKLAQAQLIQHTAEQLGVDVNELDDNELAKFASQVLAGQGMAAESPEVQEKIAEADALGRLMARSFIEEQQNMSFAGDVQEKVAEAIEDISDFWAVKIAEEEMMDEEDDEEDDMEDEDEDEDEDGTDVIAKTAMLNLAEALAREGEFDAAIKVAASVPAPVGPSFIENRSMADLKSIGLAGDKTKSMLAHLPGAQNIAAGLGGLGIGGTSEAKYMRGADKAIAQGNKLITKLEKDLTQFTKGTRKHTQALAALKAQKKHTADLIKSTKGYRMAGYKNLAAGAGKSLGAAGALGLAGYGLYRGLGGGEKTAARNPLAKNPFPEVSLVEDFSPEKLKKLGLTSGKNPSFLSHLPGAQNLGMAKALLGKDVSGGMQKFINKADKNVAKAEKALKAVGTKDPRYKGLQAALKAAKKDRAGVQKLYGYGRSAGYKHLAAGAGKALGTAGLVGGAGYGLYKALGGGDSEYKTAGYEFAKLAEERAAEIMLANGIHPETFEQVYPTEVKIAHVVTPDDVWSLEEKLAAAEFNEHLDEAAMHILESIGLV
jgi:hypothetical protein